MNSQQKIVTRDSHLRGNFRATSNLNHEIHGSIRGLLLIDKNSYVQVLGVIEGDIINNGGVLRVFGTVIGRIFNHKGQVMMESHATIIPLDQFVFTL